MLVVLGVHVDAKRKQRRLHTATCRREVSCVLHKARMLSPKKVIANITLSETKTTSPTRGSHVEFVHNPNE